MSQESIKLREERAALVARAREINDKALAESRDLTAEERTNYDSAMEKVNKLGETIKDMETREKQLAEAEAELEARESRSIAPDGTAGAPGGAKPTGDEKRDDPMVKLYSGIEQRQSQVDNEMRAFNNFIKSGVQEDELRTLQAGIDTLGGYLVTPQQFIAELIKDLDNMVFVRQYARTFTVTNAESLGAPALDTDLGDAEWTSELDTADAEDMEFNKRELRPYPLSKLVLISFKLLRAAALNPETLARQRMSYKFGVAMEKGYLTGSGAGQPLGIFTASDDGVSTARDVDSGDNTSITADALREMKYALKGPHYQKARWLFHRDALSVISRLKAEDEQYLWSPGLRMDNEDMILGRPVDMSEYAPNTFTQNLYIGALCNWADGYWIADSLQFQVQRLVELYARQNSLGLLGRAESDGMPVLEEAFVRMKLSA